ASEILQLACVTCENANYPALGQGPLGHFVAQSPWDYREVMRRVAARAHRVLRPSAWLIDDHPFVRYGHGTAGAIVQHCGERDQHLCQVAVSVHAVSRRGSSPLHWRLFLPQSWAKDRARCAKAGVPPQIAHRTKQRIALDLLDELDQWGLAPPLVVADSDYGTNVAFRTGLSARGIRWLLAVTGHTVVLPATGAPVTAWARRRPASPSTRSPRITATGPAGSSTGPGAPITPPGPAGSSPLRCTSPGSSSASTSRPPPTGSCPGAPC
uniref:IS701 family transposase n=1 Tax=Streptomyces tailanensis TaxID=2569858 RepID=UPI001C0F24BB